MCSCCKIQTFHTWWLVTTGALRSQWSMSKTSWKLLVTKSGWILITWVSSFASFLILLASKHWNLKKIHSYLIWMHKFCQYFVFYFSSIYWLSLNIILILILLSNNMLIYSTSAYSFSMLTRCTCTCWILVCSNFYSLTTHCILIPVFLAVWS